MIPHAPDAEVRARALDPSRSFIVQAPAGAGKTELLIQRLLVLLTTVERPTEILAITFTRKAAGEMRARLLEAILAARDSPCPETEPARSRWLLARQVLERDRALGWGLTEQREALLIETFDALAQRLAQAGWTLEQGIHAHWAQVDEDASELYAEAAVAALTAVDDAELVAASRLLLTRLDNRAESLVTGIADLLARRGQWAELSLPHAEHEAPGFERALVAAVEAELEVLHRLWAEADHQTLMRLARHASQHHPDKRFAEALAALVEGPPPRARIEDLSRWHVLAQLLLTQQDGTWRKTIDKNDGFPPGTSSAKAKASDPLRRAKEEMLALLAELAQQDVDGKLAARLHASRDLPDRSALAEQADVRLAMQRLLRRALVELQTRQSAMARSDFAGVFAAARYALTTNAAGIAERLDARLRHILVDEFQDTNPEQAQMLRELVSSWSPGDGRTLFLVGDPMQSIYAFRDADVRIFLHVQRHGLGSVALEALQLASNFRSRPSLIDWVNRAMPHAFARQDERLAIPFAPAQAVREEAPETGVASLVAHDDAEQEAAAIAVQIASLRVHDPEASIAVLLRTRSLAGPILAALDLAGIPVRAVEMSHLAERPVVRDLLALTMSLVYPSDRLAWMSWLRSPFVGLRLASLLALADSSSLDLDARWQSLTDQEERARLAPLVAALQRDRTQAGLQSLAERVWRVFLDCGGATVLADADTRREVNAFLEHLEALSAEGLLTDRARLHGLLARKHESFTTRLGSTRPVEVLTMHKAKGLEWDHVFLPGLDLPARVASRPPLIWQLQTTLAQGSRSSVLVAAASSREKVKGSVYDFIRERLLKAEQEESVRLLYVALTRARERLYLSGQRAQHAGLRASALAAALLEWPASNQGAAGQGKVEQAEPEPALKLAASLRRYPLPASLAPTLPPAAPAQFADAEHQHLARAVGIVGHHLLECLYRHRQHNQLQARSWLEPIAVAAQLQAQGLAPAQAQEQAKRLCQHLYGLLEQSENLRFLFGNHPEDHAETDWLVDGEVWRPDRLFRTQEGECWVVDYKFEGEGVASTAEAHRPQLERYARLVQRLGWLKPGQKPRLAVYFVWQDRLSEL